MPKPNIVSEEQFRESAKAGPVTDVQVRKAFVSEVRAPSDDSRIVTFAISTASVDRMGDTIAVNGWQLDNFKANPVVLWAHDSEMLPVAKCRRVWVESGKLMAEADFTPTPTAWPEFNETVFQFLKHGLLNATSVGFSPVRYAFSEEDGRTFGIDFLEQELHEFSIVPVPANPDCLQYAKSLGIDAAPIRDWAVKLLAEENLSLISTDRLDAINALPDELRADAKKAAGSKGASGLYRRCANRVEKAINGDEPTEPVIDIVEPVADGQVAIIEAPAVLESEIAEKTTPRLDMARRRLALMD
jgi:HK97 family phage prohead protease